MGKSVFQTWVFGNMAFPLYSIFFQSKFLRYNSPQVLAGDNNELDDCAPAAAEDTEPDSNQD